MFEYGNFEVSDGATFFYDKVIMFSQVGAFKVWSNLSKFSSSINLKPLFLMQSINWLVFTKHILCIPQFSNAVEDLLCLINICVFHIYLNLWIIIWFYFYILRWKYAEAMVLKLLFAFNIPHQMPTEVVFSILAKLISQQVKLPFNQNFLRFWLHLWLRIFKKKWSNT